ncbi:MAG: alpha/beta-hydrolase family protein [Acetobacteraceae bacterium]|nr:alpha/beta-hydrolase family protein [Acetobacteraceae bacterium]
MPAVDALTHGVEAYFSGIASPLADAIALQRRSPAGESGVPPKGDGIDRLNAMAGCGAGDHINENEPGLERMEHLVREAGAVVRGRMRALSGVGLALGTLFFGAALTPSLIPRTYSTQGVLAGISFAAGYGLGVGWRWLWAYLGLPEPPERTRRIVNAGVAVFCLAIAAIFLRQAAEWQNSIRALMGMAPLETAHPFKICLTALATFALLLALARLFRFTAGFLATRAGRLVPRRLANVVGVGAAVLLFWSLASGIFFPATLRILDSSFREYDALLKPEHPQPAEPERCGSPASIVRWSKLGRAGREFVASGPTAAAISAFTGRPAAEPRRVYVGLRAGDTVRERAQLALAELKRVGAFERSALVVITPTGTGWIDPAAMDAIEYLLGGDVASVAVQYSYLSSPLSLLVQPEYGTETAHALFTEIYGYWTTLPREHRPRFYLHGLSLGAMNSERSVELFEIIGDPIDGALWSGPPFGSRFWRSLTDDRNPGSPAWLPTFRDGRFVRFMNQNGFSVPTQAPWGPMRVVYLQYASDAVTFFDYRDFYRRPAWLEPPRGPDVSMGLRWYPIVTVLQLALDMAVSTTTPMRHGHVYAPRDYIDAWAAVADVRGWSPEAIAALKQQLSQSADKAMENLGSEEGAYSNRGG